MIIQNSSDLIRRHSRVELPSGVCAEEAELINGHALVIGRDSLSLYRRPGDCTDALGKGFIRSAGFPAGHTLPDSGNLLTEHRAGYAGLAGGYVLLIGLNDVRLFFGREDALRNHNELLRLALGD
ncbi:hypothetical protein [uncultured Thalassolituus sp.]|uniref:hypothetical protein n=1 Tax=uncultured Thalassolituus sp. TaxID=285273 RepID=UPI0026143AAA|nr:hypothetical protein [uncultured Thalassolituus sp.]